MSKSTISILFLVLIFLLSACENKLSKSFLSELDTIKPDQRTAVFNLEQEYKNGRWVFDLETSNSEHSASLKSLLSKHFSEDNYQLNIRMLPDSAFGDSIYALVNVSVGNLRRQPKHSAELVDQVLMGMPVRLLKKQSYWYLIQTHYDYLGWITRGTLERITSNELSQYEASNRYILNTNFEHILNEPLPGSQIISDAVLGCVIRAGERKGNWITTVLPDGREGYLPYLAVKPYKAYGKNKTINRKTIVARAKQLTGVPYLWGGHSTKAFDCSGFTSTVFRTAGYTLPRDAYMQAKEGEEIIPNEDYSNVIPGDLIFFGSEKRITHVGICLGGSYFIHCSSDVHVNSLDEKDVLFNRHRKRSFRHIKRIIKD
jgi:hypothetical protein